MSSTVSSNNGGKGRFDRKKKGSGKGGGKNGKKTSYNNKDEAKGPIVLSTSDFSTLSVHRSIQNMLGTNFAIRVVFATAGNTVQVLRSDKRGNFTEVIGVIDDLRIISSIHREIKECEKEVQSPINRDSWEVMYKFRFKKYETYDDRAEQSPLKSLKDSLKHEPTRLTALKMLEHNYAYLEDCHETASAGTSTSTKLEEYALLYLRIMTRAVLGVTNFEHVRISNLDKAHREQRTFRELLFENGIPKWLHTKLTTERMTLPPLRFLFRTKMLSGLRLTLREIIPGSPTVKYLGILMQRSSGQLALSHLLYHTPLKEGATRFISDEDFRSGLTDHVKMLDDAHVYVNPPTLPSAGDFLQAFRRYDAAPTQVKELSVAEAINPIAFIPRVSIELLNLSVGASSDMSSTMAFWRALDVSDDYVINNLHVNKNAAPIDKLKEYVTFLDGRETSEETTHIWNKTPIQRDFFNITASVDRMLSCLKVFMQPGAKRPKGVSGDIIAYVKLSYPSIEEDEFKNDVDRFFNLGLAFIGDRHLRMTDCMVFETATENPPLLWKQIRDHNEVTMTGKEMEDFYKVPKKEKNGTQTFEANLSLIKSKTLIASLIAAKSALDSAKVSTAGLTRYVGSVRKLQKPLQDVAAGYVEAAFANYTKDIALSAAQAENNLNKWGDEDSDSD